MLVYSCEKSLGCTYDILMLVALLSSDEARVVKTPLSEEGRHLALESNQHLRSDVSDHLSLLLVMYAFLKVEAGQRRAWCDLHYVSFWLTLCKARPNFFNMLPDQYTPMAEELTKVF